MNDTTKQSPAIDIAHEYVALKSALRHKIMDFSRSKNEEIFRMFKTYLEKEKEYNQDMKRLDEIYRKSQEMTMSFDDNKDFARLVPKINTYQRTDHMLLLNQEGKEKKKELTQLFREENRSLIDQYKQIADKNRFNQSRAEFAIRLLQRIGVTDLDMDAFRKSIGFENPDIPRYMRDKQKIESRGIDIQQAIATLTSREAEAVGLYLQGGNMKELAAKRDMTSKRVGQIKKKGLRRLRNIATNASKKQTEEDEA